MTDNDNWGGQRNDDPEKTVRGPYSSQPPSGSAPFAGGQWGPHPNQPPPNYHQGPYQGPPQPGYQQPAYQQPQYQQPHYQQPGYQQTGYQQPGYPNQFAAARTQSAQKSRTPLYIGLGAAAVVLLLVVAAVAVFSGGGSKSDPDDVVVAYLDKLAKGDAKGALALGAAPATDTFATDEILKKQQQAAEISDVKIVGSDVIAGTARVHATYQFGKQKADVTYELAKSDDDWAMKDTTVAIDTSSFDTVPEPTLFGKSLEGLSKVYVFPGPLQWGSANKNFEVVDSKGDAFATGTGYEAAGSSYVSLETTLNDTGTKAATKAVTDMLTECAKSTSFKPDNCPQNAYVYRGVEGSARWTAPRDLSPLEFSYSGYSGATVRVSGALVWAVTYQERNFDGVVADKTDNDVSTSLYGDIDMSKDPAVLKLN